MNYGKRTGPLRGSAVGKLYRDPSRRGQTLVEYALILAFICLVAVGVMISMTNQVNKLYSTIGSAISTATASH